MAKRNPHNSSIQQALLDLTDSGYGSMTVDQLITKLAGDPKLVKTLQAKWNGHTYPEKAMTWAQLAKEQRLLTLSSDAIKVLAFCGMYCHQSTLLQVSYKDLSAATGIKDRSLRTAVRELLDAGCLRIERPSIRHASPIYGVNPAVVNKGVRRRSDADGFAGKATCCDYILQRELSLVVQEETVYEDAPDGGRTAYNRIALVAPGAVPTKERQRRERKREEAPAQLPGQLSFDDLGWRADEA